MKKPSPKDLATEFIKREPSLYLIGSRFVLHNQLLILEKADDELMIYLRDNQPDIYYMLGTPDSELNFEKALLNETARIEGRYKLRTPYPLTSIAQEALKADYQYYDFPLHDFQWTILNGILYHPYEIEKFFVISGAGGTGKSTFTNLIKQLMKGDYGIMPNYKEDSNFGVGDYAKYRVAIADDCMGELPINAGDCKNITTHDEFLASVKHQRGEIIPSPQCIFLFNCNLDVYINFTDSGMLRRVCWKRLTEPIKSPDASKLHSEYTHDQLLKIAIRARAYDWKSNFEKEFSYDTLQAGIRCNSVWKYLSKNDIDENNVSYDYYREWYQDSIMRGDKSRQSYMVGETTFGEASRNYYIQKKLADRWHHEEPKSQSSAVVDTDIEDLPF